MTQRERNAEEYRSNWYSPNLPYWAMCVDYMNRYGSITQAESSIAFGDNKLSTTVWYCRNKKGISIKSQKNPNNLKTHRIFSFGEDDSPPHYTHKSHPRLYSVWLGMRERCNHTYADSYEHYGGRGIKVCDEWNTSFEVFAEWALANGYDSNARYGECTLDRIDVNGNYKPSNCRWATTKEQANNKRDNVVIHYQDESRTIAEWSEVLEICPSSLRRRLLSGWSVDEAISIKPRKKCLHLTHKGETKSVSEWAKITNIPSDTISKRIKTGWSVDRALTTPVKKQKNNRSIAESEVR